MLIAGRSFVVGRTSPLGAGTQVGYVVAPIPLAGKEEVKRKQRARKLEPIQLAKPGDHRVNDSRPAV